MNTNNKLSGFRQRKLAAPSAVLVLCLAGCEHRIGLQEFLAAEQVRQQATNQPAAPSRAGAASSDRFWRHRTGPGDVLAVTTTPREAAAVVPVQARVDSSGFIELPMVGKIQVNDLTLEEAEAAVRNAYVPKFHLQAAIHVQVVAPAVTNVMVVGAVAAPGLVQLTRTERNLLFAVHRAGGSSQLASGQVTLRRLSRPEQNTTLNLRDADNLAHALALEPLGNGDIVFVHAAKPNTVFVGGLVNVAGPQAYPPDTEVTILQAVAAAGGLRTDLLPREATLIRRVEGKDVHVKLNLNRLAKGKDENIVLAAGDILWVPHTAGTRVHEFINNTVYIQVGASAFYGARYYDIGSRRYGDEKQAGRDTVIVGP